MTQKVKSHHGWVRSTVDEPSFGFSRSAWWGRFRLQVDEFNDEMYYIMVDDAILNHVDVHFVESGGQVTHFRGGGFVPVAERDQPFRSHVFVLPGQGKRDVEVYIRVSSALAVVMPVQVIASRYFAELNTTGAWVYSVYFGFLFAMLIFNFIVGVRLRQAINLYYCGFVLGMILLALSFSGFGRQFFWPGPEWIDNVMLSFACAATGISATLFNEKYLFDSLGRGVLVTRVARWLVLMVGFLACLLTTAGWLREGMIMSTLCAGIAVIFFIISTLVGIRFKVHGARLLLFAWSGILLGAFTFIGRAFGIFPSNFFTTYSLQFSSVLESFLLMVAIIEKSRHMRVELEKTNARIRASLEDQVEVRTAELRHAQQQLIEQERRQSLVVFAAGMAHEINNPANFVAAGAQDVMARQRCLYDMLVEMVDESEHPLLVQELKSRFESREALYQSIRHETEKITRAVAEVRQLNPEGNAGRVVLSLVDVLDNAVKRVALNFQERVIVHYEWSVEPHVEGVLSEINVALETLITNAMEAVLERAPDEAMAAPEIRLAVVMLEGWVQVVVEDNGPGVPHEWSERIFEPFFSTKPSGQGAGLGLATARDIARRHGGDISLDRSFRRGARFLLTLPSVGEDRSMLSRSDVATGLGVDYTGA